MVTDASPKTLQQAILYFSDYENCHKAMIGLRWPDGTVTCPTCGSTKVTYLATARVWKCYEKHPKAKFSLKVGTIFEDSPIPLQKWFPALWMIVNCKNGISSYELGRALGVTQKSAWFMLSRLRLAMQEQHGQFSGHVEADETFIGGKARFMHHGKKMRVRGSRPGVGGKIAVWGVLERNSPDRKSRVVTKVVKNIRRESVLMEVKKNVKQGSNLYTDALKSYEMPSAWGPSDYYMHQVIDHATSYANGHVHTNGMENFWSLLKRMIKGTYVSIEPFHLFRYLDEQCYRFNERGGTDQSRFFSALKGVLGRRLTYTALTGSELPQTC